MVKLSVKQVVFLTVIGSLLMFLIAIKSYNYFKEKKFINSQEKVDEIRTKKDIEIAKKQKEIDSILVDLQKNYETIIFLKGKIDVVNNDNKNLEKELARRKSEIVKMSNDEIVKYWEYEFKK